MEMWLFFVIFGAVITIPTTIVLLLLNHFKKTILVVIKKNGTIKKVVIDDKILASGQITQIKKQKIKPIKIEQTDVRYGSMRRWIIKDLENLPPSTEKQTLSDSEIEAYLNSETINMLLLFGKLKDLLFLLLGIIIFLVIIGVIINGYLTSTHQVSLSGTNETMQVITAACKQAFLNPVMGVQNAGIAQ